MPDEKDLKIEHLEKEIVDLKIRLKRIEDFLLDSHSEIDPRDYIQETTDSSFEEALQLILQFNTASASFLQRKMSIGYAAAARLLDSMESKGFVSPPDGAKPREVYLDNIQKYFSSEVSDVLKKPLFGTNSNELLEKAIKIIRENQKASATFLQKKMDIGYARAARLIDEIEEKGIISKFEEGKPRKVLK